MSGHRRRSAPAALAAVLALSACAPVLIREPVVERDASIAPADRPPPDAPEPSDTPPPPPPFDAGEDLPSPDVSPPEDLPVAPEDLPPVEGPLGPLTTAQTALLRARPFVLLDPAGAATDLRPLVVVLHGFAAAGSDMRTAWNLDHLVRERQVYVALPDGTPVVNLGMLPGTSLIPHAWNATDGCCAVDMAAVDDVAYLTAVVTDIVARRRIDRRRVFFFGHSNGGFMAYRMACDRPDLVRAVVSLAGAVWSDPARCTPSQPVAVLQLHGDRDETIAYGGGTAGFGPVRFAPHPSAEQTVAFWAARNRCGAPRRLAETLDLVTTLPGAETWISRHEGCDPGGAAELWTLAGAPHSPVLVGDFAVRVYDHVASRVR